MTDHIDPQPSEKRSRRRLFAALAFAAAGIAYAVMNHVMLGDVLAFFDDRGFYKSSVYLAWIGCGFLVFAGVLVTAPRVLLYPLLALFFVSLATNYTYVLIKKVPLTLDVIEWLPHEAGQLSNAWTEYWPEIASGIVKAAALLALFLLIRRALHKRGWRAQRPHNRWRLGALAVGAFLAFHGAAVVLQPPQTVAETNLFIFGVPSLLSSTPDLRAIAVAPARSALVEKIVLVVDESVTYEAYEKLIASRIRQLPITDFGEAASIANCSAPSNALLRWGVEKARIRDAAHDPRTNPSIWGYAKGAGFRTVLIDGQSRGHMHNYLNTKEFALIDEFVPARLDMDTDQGIAQMLRERLRRPGREFIYVVKQGAHFPYEMNYPRELAPRDDSRIARYVAAVSYTTGGFFERLTADLPFSNLLLIYTSDHGQDFDERGLHCSSAPRAEEYSVPLITITTAPTLQALLSAAPGMHNRASHLNIFSTALYGFGYANDWIERTYGPTLAGPPSPYITYVSLGWKASSRKERSTVKTTDFVESIEFPRSNGSPRRQHVLGVAQEAALQY